MSPREAYRLFLAALSTMSLTVVPKGNSLRIEDAGVARHDTVTMMRKGVPDDEQVVRYVLRPSYTTAEVLVQALGTLKSDIGEVTQIGSMLMMTDYGGNVRDMLSLVKLVDVPKGSEGIYTISIEHANAKTVSEKVGGILAMPEGAAAPAKPGQPGATAAPSTPSKVMVDERTNTILLAASQPAFERYRALAKRIDIPLDIEGGQSAHVHKLKNAIAEELAKTLNDTFGQQTQTAQPARPVTDASAPQIEGKVRVMADKSTNTLLVLSTGRDYLALKEVIDALDQPRPQVYIETMIVEITVNNELLTDGSVHGTSAFDKALLFGGAHTTSFNSVVPVNTAEPASSSVASRGLVLGMLGPSVSALGLTLPSYGVLFNALATSSRTNVLSTPAMMALDNETAKFKVGRKYPVEGKVVVSAAGTATTGGPEYQNLDLELELKPHITSDDQILLEVKHASEDEGERVALGPSFNTRAYETRVLVKDQQTIVIGGILQEKTAVTKSSIPLLGDIPLLGRLFSYNNKQKRKSNTLILLTPYIIRSHLDLERIRLRKVQEQEEFVGSLKAFDGMKYQAKMDYGRKCGLVEEINRAVKTVEEDKRTLESMQKTIVIPTGPVDVPADDTE
jgi:general secretion pathway protein D